ncbi:MAG: hypothetical protein H7A47_15395 [Verrucomicrobiales bacterium]|nr:hypothetical protein [Verrucomicrobiales bacterium]
MKVPVEVQSETGEPVAVWVTSGGGRLRADRGDPDDRMQKIRQVQGSEPGLRAYDLDVNDGPVLISKKDGLWRVWKQQTPPNLVVLADLPPHLCPNREDCRAIIPLGKKVWKHLRGKPVRVEITDRGVELLDRPRGW